MYGRYGVDKLFYALGCAYFILNGINSFSGYGPIYLVGLAVIGVCPCSGIVEKYL